MRPRSLATLVLAMLAVLLVGSPALAVDAPYPPAGVRVVTGTVSPLEVADGGSVTFSGSGYAPGTLLRLSVDGVDVRTLTADSAGAFATMVQLLGVGEHVIAVSGLEANGRVRVVSAIVTVAATGSQAPLGATGSDVLPALGGGLALVLVGAGLVFAAKARTSRRGQAASLTAA